MHLIWVGGDFLLLLFLLAWAWGFQVEWKLLVWLAILFLSSMEGAVTCSICHGNILLLISILTLGHR